MRKITFTNANNQAIILTPENKFLCQILSGIDGPQATLQLQNAPYQDGATFIDALYDSRTIEVQGVILYRDLASIFAFRQTMLQILSSKIGLGVLTIQTDNGIRTITAIPSIVTFANKQATDAYQSVLIDFFCPNPYFIDPVQNQIQLITLVSLESFPAYFPKAFSQYVGGTAVDAFNAGHVPAPVKITFYGPATNPKFTNQTTGAFLKVIKTLAAGDTLVIDTSFETTSIVFTPSGGSPTNGLGYMSTTVIGGVAPSFWQLPVGHNAIVFSDDASNTSDRAIITWFNRYIGV